MALYLPGLVPATRAVPTLRAVTGPAGPEFTVVWGWFAGKMVSWKRANWKMMGLRRPRMPLVDKSGVGKKRGRSTTAIRMRRSLTGD